MDIGDGQNPASEVLESTTNNASREKEWRKPSFEEIYREHGERILCLLYRFTSHEPAARDLLQDVFVKVYENLDSFGHRSQLYTWIYRIAVNHALNYLKRERRNLWIDLMDESVGELLRKETIEAPGLGSASPIRPDEVYERTESDKLIENAIQSLRPNYRIPFLLYRDEHLSYAEIAEVLQMNVSSVASRIHRARKILIKKLEPLLK